MIFEETWVVTAQEFISKNLTSATIDRSKQFCHELQMKSRGGSDVSIENVENAAATLFPVLREAKAKIQQMHFPLFFRAKLANL